MEEKLMGLKNEALSMVFQAQSLEELEQIRIQFLGKKGKFTLLLKDVPKLPPDERPTFGRLANEIKLTLEKALEEKNSQLKAGGKLDKEWIDITIPGKKPPEGHLHLITQAIEEISSIFENIGFTIRRYPEVEWDWYAFEGLNMPKNHPARDEWETFFIDGLTDKNYGDAVLTPHTTSGDLREMERIKALPAARLPDGQGRQAPIRMLNIGKCYRRQSDVSHAPMFYQFDGLVIDKEINITHLKGTIDYFVKRYFGPDRKSRIRPFHFQFTEPSFEVDITCIICNGKGCKVCKEGWLELGGSGMVHPTVLRNGGIDPSIYTGFAWGWGVERVMMMKHGIPDIRLLFESDVRFLKQF